MADELQVGLVGLIATFGLFYIERCYSQVAIRALLGISLVTAGAVLIHALGLDIASDAIDFLDVNLGALLAVAVIEAYGVSSGWS